MLTVHLTKKSTNAKTGPIPVSTTSANSCPDTCSLKNNGCYASSGPLALHWSKVTAGERGDTWQRFCDDVAAFPDGQLWRHNQAGDLPHINGQINSLALSNLVKANRGRNGFTYTHHIPSGRNLDLIFNANRQGFTINLSAESFIEADNFLALNVAPVVTIMPHDAPNKLLTPAGNVVIKCPATYRDNVTCASCALCQKQRKSIIGFPVHGTSKAKAQKVFFIKSV